MVEQDIPCPVRMIGTFSKRRGRKCIALPDIACTEAPTKPRNTLGGSAMGKAVRNDIALRFFLKSVVTDSGRRIQTGLHITAFQNIFGVVGPLRPHARKTVRPEVRDGQIGHSYLADWSHAAHPSPA